MSGGPNPSRLVLLSDLRHLKDGQKVRFLGCVQVYDINLGALVLKHDYPHSASVQVEAHVNLDHVLETLKNTDLEIGAWVNVIGYKSALSMKSTKSGDRLAEVGIQALVLWEARDVKVDEYEKALEARTQE